MSKTTVHRLALLVSLGTIAACTSQQSSLESVQKEIASRTGKRVAWLRGGPEDAEASRAVQTLLRRQLSANNAVQIALLNNRALQAKFEEIGISQADLVQAGLLSNPTFAASWRFPDRSPREQTPSIQLRRTFCS